MSRLSLLPGSAAVPQRSFTFPVLTVLASPSVPREQWFQLSPEYHGGRIVGATLLLPDGMTAAAQLDQIESAIREIRRHIGPDGSLLQDRIPAEQPRKPQLALVPAQRRGESK